MFQQKFNLNSDNIVEQVEEWTQQFFFDLMNTLNGFFANISVEETLERLKCINFANLALEQLEDESDLIKSIASAKIQELAKNEIGYIEAYIE